MLDVIVATTTCQLSHGCARVHCIEYGAAAIARVGAGARAGGSRMRSWSWKPFSDGVGNVVNFSHAFFGLMMHLRSQHRRSSSNNNPYYGPNSSSSSAFPSAVKWNAATCNGNNLRKQSLQFTVLMSITKTNSSWHTAPSRLWPIYHSTMFGFRVLCTPNNYARFPTGLSVTPYRFRCLSFC